MVFSCCDQHSILGPITRKTFYLLQTKFFHAHVIVILKASFPGKHFLFGENDH